VLTRDETALEKFRRPDDGPDLEGLGDAVAMMRLLAKPTLADVGECWV